MSQQEMQQEEREVLLSIYEGDGNFFDIGNNKYQYKIGEHGASRSVLLEVTWGDNYPDALPSISLDAFYNKHLIPNVKDAILRELMTQADGLKGSASTYTLFEYAKENLDTLLTDQPESLQMVASTYGNDPNELEDSPAKVKERKEVLTKNQKRKLYDKFGTHGMGEEKPRGWDWVDVVKHLCQTGLKPDGAV